MVGHVRSVKFIGPRLRDDQQACRCPQARFVDEYLIDLNATQAAIRAGYSAKTAQPQSSRLLSKVIVRAAIVDGKGERHTESVMSAVEALERASTIGRWTFGSSIATTSH